MIEWLINVYFPNVFNSSLFILDSWNTYKNRQMIDKITPKEKKVSLNDFADNRFNSTF